MPRRGKLLFLFAFQFILLPMHSAANPAQFDQLDRDHLTYMGEIIDRAEKMKLDLDPFSVLEEIALAVPAGRLAMGAKVVYREGLVGTAHAGMSCQALKKKMANSLFANSETLDKCYQSDSEFKDLDQRRRSYLAKNFKNAPKKSEVKCEKDQITFPFSGKKVRAVFHPENTDSTGRRQLNFFEVPRLDQNDPTGGIKIFARVNICTEGLCKMSGNPDLKDINVNAIKFNAPSGDPMSRISFALGDIDIPTMGSRDQIARSLARIKPGNQDAKSGREIANMLMTPEYFMLHRDHLLSLCDKPSLSQPIRSSLTQGQEK